MVIAQAVELFPSDIKTMGSISGIVDSAYYMRAMCTEQRQSVALHLSNPDI